MNFIETRGNDGSRPAKVTFSDAILKPLASFGGLYVPRDLPYLGEKFLQAHKDSSFKKIAKSILDEYQIDIDDQVIEEAISLYDSFDDPNCPVPLVKLNDNQFVSELYHGPTRAFKDMALQPFGKILSSLAESRNEKYLILAATSGDTGPATLETFKGDKNVFVTCLYPVGGTSDVQRLQMVTEDANNLCVVGINGAFDDAQSALKTLLSSDAFQNKLSKKGIKLSAANSVNFGRIIFQQIYHVYSYLQLVKDGEISLGGKIYINVPSGNFGNALGGYYAMKMGLPIEKILISSNKNNVLTDLIKNGKYDLTSREVISTSTPAMDILKSSNVERVLYDLFGQDRTRQLMEKLDSIGKYELSSNELKKLQEIFAADFATDQQVKEHIQVTYKDGYLIDPHTATCMQTEITSRKKDYPSIIYSTAEWTKFSKTIVNALSDETISSDQEALNLISSLTNYQVPKQILDLFQKQQKQRSIIDKNEIEQKILAFIETKL